MAGETPIVEARRLRLYFGGTEALRNANLTVYRGEAVALMGPSGSGKSSLLHCLSGVLVPDSGEVSVCGCRLDQLSDARRSQLRLERIGMVFQFGNLIPELTLLENVMLPLLLAGRSSATAKSEARHVLDQLDVAEVASRHASEVSGGQAQRAAVARALVHRPPVVFADEPTGALDSVNGERVLDALLSLAKERGSAVFVVTHENAVAARLDRLVLMHDGSVLDESLPR